MPAFKARVLSPVIESLLFEEFMAGNSNWVPDFVLAELAWQKKGVRAKADDFRRVCSDLWHANRIRKLAHKSFYKCLQAPIEVPETIKG